MVCSDVLSDCSILTDNDFKAKNQSRKRLKSKTNPLNRQNRCQNQNQKQERLNVNLSLTLLMMTDLIRWMLIIPRNLMQKLSLGATVKLLSLLKMMWRLLVRMKANTKSRYGNKTCYVSVADNGGYSSLKYHETPEYDKLFSHIHVQHTHHLKVCSANAKFSFVCAGSVYHSEPTSIVMQKNKCQICANLST